jgi:hypothetical protein
MNVRTARIDRTLTAIAQQHLGVETLATRKADSLDFHEVSVWNIKAALEAAYAAGAQTRKASNANSAMLWPN